MTQTESPKGTNGPFANLYNRLGLAWWVEIKTKEPECTYYFGPFLTAAEAQSNMPGYIQDLEQEQAVDIEAMVRRCKPRNVTICPD